MQPDPSLKCYKIYRLSNADMNYIGVTTDDNINGYDQLSKYTSYGVEKILSSEFKVELLKVCEPINKSDAKRIASLYADKYTIKSPLRKIMPLRKTELPKKFASIEHLNAISILNHKPKRYVFKIYKIYNDDLNYIGVTTNIIINPLNELYGFNLQKITELLNSKIKLDVLEFYPADREYDAVLHSYSYADSNTIKLTYNDLKSAKRLQMNKKTSLVKTEPIVELQPIVELPIKIQPVELKTELSKKRKINISFEYDYSSISKWSCLPVICKS